MKPLWSGCWLQKADASKTWVHFKYEIFQGLCYKCGVFGHEQKNCSRPLVMAAYDKNRPKYGPFLNASKPRMFTRLPFGFTEGSGSSAQDSNGEENESNGQEATEDNIPTSEENVSGEECTAAEGRITSTIIHTPRGDRVITKFPCKKYRLPPRTTPPPYYVEFPPEEEEEDVGSSSNQIPSHVEDALSQRFAGDLRLKRRREKITASLTGGEDLEYVQDGVKRARLVSVVEGNIVT